MKKSILITLALVFAMSFPILAQENQTKKEPATDRLALDQDIQRNRPAFGSDRTIGDALRSNEAGIGRKPLFVVDGVVATEGANPNPMDTKMSKVASITVVQDPVQLATYGPKGANGVILFTTKRSKVD